MATIDKEPLWLSALQVLTILGGIAFAAYLFNGFFWILKNQPNYQALLEYKCAHAGGHMAGPPGDRGAYCIKGQFLDIQVGEEEAAKWAASRK